MNMRHPAAWQLASIALLAVAALTLPLQAAAAQTLRIGVLAFRPAADTLARWQPTADYLGAQLPGYRFEIVPAGYPELEAAVASHQVDLVLTNPSHYIVLNADHQLQRIATLVVDEQGRNLTAFGGVIAVRAGDAHLQEIEDLRGATVASPERGSLGGYQVQAQVLQEAGLDPQHDVTMLFTGMPHDRALEALLAGQADAAFVRTGVVEGMLAEGRLAPEQLRVLNRQRLPSFPFLLSTRLYPEWPLSIQPHVDERLARRIAAALLSLPEDTPAARQGGYTGWAYPADYEPVRRLLETLSLPPYDGQRRTRPVAHTDASVLPVAAGALVVLTLGLLTVLAVLARSKRQITMLRTELDRSRNRLGTLAGNLPGASYRCLADNTLRQPVEVDQGIEDLTGYPAEHFLSGRVLFGDLCFAEDRSRIDEAIARAIADDHPYVLDYRIRHADGGTRHLHERGRPTRDAEGRVWLDGIVLDAEQLRPRD